MTLSFNPGANMRCLRDGDTLQSMTRRMAARIRSIRAVRIMTKKDPDLIADDRGLGDIGP